MSDDQENNAAYRTLVGSYPHTVLLIERPDRGGVVYLRYIERGGLQDGKRVNTPIEGKLTLRNTQGGLIQSRVDRAVKSAEAVQLRLASHDIGLVSRPEEALRALTLREGFDAWLDPESGAFVPPTRQSRQYQTAAKAVQRALRPNTTWESLTPDSMARMWPILFSEWCPKSKKKPLVEDDQAAMQGERPKSKQKPKAPGGPAAMKDAGKSLVACQNWLVRNRHLPSKPMGELEGWQSKLASAIQKMMAKLKSGDRRYGKVTFDASGKLVPNRERYTPAEYGAVLTAFRSPDLDPRVKLLGTVGAEVRLGTVSEAMRSDLDLDPGVFHPHGRLFVKGHKNKRGGSIVFSSAERAVVDQELITGYLKELEAAYQAREIDDYPLFPGDRMTRLGPAHTHHIKYAADVAYTSITDPSLRERYAEADALAGVPHIPGLGWRGARRTASDIAADLSTDIEVRDYLGFWWSPKGTRERVYNDNVLREQKLAKAASDLRQQVRRYAIHCYALLEDATRVVPAAAAKGGSTRRSRSFRHWRVG